VSAERKAWRQVSNPRQRGAVNIQTLLVPMTPLELEFLLHLAVYPAQLGQVVQRSLHSHRYQELELPGRSHQL
jgi:hypothetical protein